MTTGADWAEQARRLLEAVKAAATPEGSADGSTEPDEHPAGECKWCPHCQLLAVLRGDRPEVTAILDDVLATASAALHSFAGEAAAEEPAGHGEEPSHRDPSPVVQRIEIACPPPPPPCPPSGSTSAAPRCSAAW